MLNARYKDVFNSCLKPLASGLVRFGVSPLALTLAGPVLATIACLWFIHHTDAVMPFSVAIILIACLDALDGAVARAAGKVTKFGGYLDAMCDRYIESFTVITVAYVTGYWLLSSAVVVGMLLISYAKARAAMEVPVSNLEWPDLMERTERDLIFIVGFAIGMLSPWRVLGHDLFWWTLVVLTVFIYLTVIQRILRARRIIQGRSGMNLG